MKIRLACMVLLALGMPEMQGSYAIENPNKGKGEVDLEIRGLVALDTNEAGVLKALFLSPAGDVHKPVLAVDIANLPEEPEQQPGLPPDLVAPAPGGHGNGLWAFQVVELIEGNVDGVLDQGNQKKVEGKAGWVTNDRTRWIPTMTDIHNGIPKRIKSNAVAAATGKFTRGKMLPIFDRDANEEQLFTIGTRRCTAVADGLRLTVKVKKLEEPLLELKRLDEKGNVIASWKMTFRNKTLVNLTNYPLAPSRKPLDHFHHYVKLVDGGSTATVDENCPMSFIEGATAYPMRCAPVKFP